MSTMLSADHGRVGADVAGNGDVLCVECALIRLLAFNFWLLRALQAESKRDVNS